MIKPQTKSLVALLLSVHVLLVISMDLPEAMDRPEPPSKRAKTSSPLTAIADIAQAMDTALRTLEDTLAGLGISERRSVSKLLDDDQLSLLKFGTGVGLPVFKATKHIEKLPTFLGGGKDSRWAAIKMGLTVNPDPKVKEALDKEISNLEAAKQQYELMSLIDDDADKIGDVMNAYIALCENTDDRKGMANNALTIFDLGTDLASDAISREILLEALLPTTQPLVSVPLKLAKILLPQLMKEDASGKTLKTRLVDAITDRPSSFQDLIWYERVVRDVDADISSAPTTVTKKVLGFDVEVPNPNLLTLHVESKLYTLRRDLAAATTTLTILPVLLPVLSDEGRKGLANELQKIYAAHQSMMNDQERFLCQKVIDAIRGN